MLHTQHHNLLTQTLLHILPLTRFCNVICGHGATVKKNTQICTLKCLLCLLFLFPCRVRTGRKRGRRRERPERKRECAGAAAAMAIVWCLAPSPVVLPAHCAARPCRKSMACSARVSNTTVAGVHVPTLALSLTQTCTGATLTNELASIFIPVTACTSTHSLEGALKQAHRQTNTCTPIMKTYSIQ